MTSIFLESKFFQNHNYNLLRFTSVVMKLDVRLIPVPGVLWIVPVDRDPDKELEPNKQLYLHIIPQNTTYQILLDIDIPIRGLFDAMVDVLGQFKSEKDQDEAEYNIYWKKSNVNAMGSDVSTTMFPNGATLLMTEGDPIFPTFHSGKLWQCDTCPYSFNSFTNLNEHVWKTKGHKIGIFGTPIGWGVVKVPQVTTEIPTNNRREMMEEAIKEPETFLNKFFLDDDDKKWELEVARHFVVTRSNKWKSNEAEMSPEFVQAIRKGTNIPENCRRQMPGTWDAYRPQLHKIMTFYQSVKKRPLHYRDLFAFGTGDLIHMSDPEEFFNNWKGATPEMLKKCLAAHNTLQRLARNAALCAKGLESFGNAYKDPKDAATRGIIDRDNFVKNLDQIEHQVKDKGLWSTYAIQADAKRKHANQLKDKLENKGDKGDNTEFRLAVDKFVASEYAIQSEKDLLDVAAGNLKLCNTKCTKCDKCMKWNKLTEFVLTRLQVFSGGRREASDMTVGEWESRIEDEDGTATIDRSFTKLEGTLQTFLHLDDVETYLLQAYEIARFNQFPELENEDRRHLQSFFVNAQGKCYLGGQKGNINHLTEWNRITDRDDVITDFRRNMGTWAISADQVTRANSAFVCAHSVEIMTKVYAKQTKKRKEGIKVLERYRDEALGRSAALSPGGRSKFLTLQLPPELEERQRTLRIKSYDQDLYKAIHVERVHHMELHRDKPDRPVSEDSKASLFEIMAEELKSEVPISAKFGFLADMLLNREKGSKKKYIQMETSIAAILSAIDSPRFAENPSAISLKEILIIAAANKIANRVDVIEREVGQKWVRSIDNFTRDGVKLQNFRQKAAFVSLANSAGNENTYSLGNTTIASQTRKMQNARKKLLHDDHKIQEIQQGKNEERKQKKAQEKQQKAIDLLKSPPTPNRQSPRRKRTHSDGKMVAKELFLQPPQSKKNANENEQIQKEIDPESLEVKVDSPTQEEMTPEKCTNENNPTQEEITMSTPPPENTANESDRPSPVPIIVDINSGGRRKANWDCDQRKTLLSHIIKHMKNPTLEQGRQSRRDLEKNVFPKVSPNIVEAPLESRKLEDIVRQWFRYVY